MNSLSTADTTHVSEVADTGAKLPRQMHQNGSANGEDALSLHEKSQSSNDGVSPILRPPGKGEILATINADDSNHKAETTPTPTSLNSSALHCRQIQPLWHPSILQIGPIIGLAALLLAVVLILASYAVLAASNGDLVVNWEFQPTVYLAIFTAVGNKAVAFACVQGTIVTFWLRALKGTTLGQLHRDWGFGLYTYKAIISGRNFNILALACICATFVAIDGPLLQRASSVRLQVPDQHPELQVSITPELPSYWSGIADFSELPGVEIQDFQIPFISTFNEWLHGEPIRKGIYGCTGTCKATVRAPALGVASCDHGISYKNFSHPMTPSEVKKFEKGCNYPNAHQQVFGSRFMLLNGSTEMMNYTTVLSDRDVANNCAGNVHEKTCHLFSGTAEYEVSITDGVITFEQSPSYPNIVSRAKNTAITKESIQEHHLDHGRATEGTNAVRTTLGGIANAANIAYYQKIGLVAYPGQPNPSLEPAVNRYLFQHILNYADILSSRACAPAWKDPRDAAMASLNELLFRVGVDTAAKYNETFLKARIGDGMEINTTVVGTITGKAEVFHSDFSWFAGAAALELFCIFAILLTFYGWWDLGRHFSFSPLEVAKAFDAPLFQDVASNTAGNAIAKLEGARQVRYGVVVDSKNELKLVVADKEFAQVPSERRRSLVEDLGMIKSRFLRRRVMDRHRHS